MRDSDRQIPKQAADPASGRQASCLNVRRGAARRSLPLLLLPLILLASCASDSAIHARKVALKYYDERPGIDKLGAVTEHEIDMTEGGYVFLDGNLALRWKGFTDDMKMIGFQGVGINLMHYNMCQRLARTWLPDNRMRASLKKTYGGAYREDLLDGPKVAFHYWSKVTGFWTMQHSWVYLDSKIFGKESIEELTREDVKAFFRDVKNQKLYNVSLRYLGTAKVPFPPLGWGYINFFDCVAIKPKVDLANR